MLHPYAATTHSADHDAQLAELPTVTNIAPASETLCHTPNKHYWSPELNIPYLIAYVSGI